jgi:branched-chain amino acid transport system substrate-binding protein
MLLAGCGTNRQEGGSAAGSSCDTSKGTIVIGMIAPMSGGESAIGLGMKNSASLAIDQANQNCTVPGYRLAFQPEDDQATPQVAAQAASKLASDPHVAAVVGTYNSSTAQSAMPILAQNHIVEISSGNTSPALTLGDSPATNPKRPFDNYFRLCATDLVQAPFGAQYLVQKAGKKRIAVIDDGKTYGVGLADNFVKEAKKLGATIVDRERVGEKDTDFSSVIAKVRPHTPDAVYYGGEYPAAGPLSKQLAEAGLNVPLMGGDGIEDKQYVALGGRQGDMATSVGVPAEQLPSAKSFTDAYAAKNYPEAPSAYGVLTYDAANVVITGLAKVVASAPYDDSSRQKLVNVVQQTNMQGASGQVSFDKYGDTTNKVLTIYTVRGDDFAPLQTGTFSA